MNEKFMTQSIVSNFLWCIFRTISDVFNDAGKNTRRLINLKNLDEFFGFLSNLIIYPENFGIRLMLEIKKELDYWEIDFKIVKNAIKMFLWTKLNLALLYVGAE